MGSKNSSEDAQKVWLVIKTSKVEREILCWKKSGKENRPPEKNIQCQSRKFSKRASLWQKTVPLQRDRQPEEFLINYLDELEGLRMEEILKNYWTSHSGIMQELMASVYPLGHVGRRAGFRNPDHCIWAEMLGKKVVSMREQYQMEV